VLLFGAMQPLMEALRLPLNAMFLNAGRLLYEYPD
jgi:hypothetical protein